MAHAISRSAKPFCHLIGRLVEVVSGQKLEDYFRQHIFAPLKMSDTSYNVKAARLVAARQRAGDRMDGAIVLQTPRPGLTISRADRLPRSADFSFIADGRDKWGLGFLITVDQVPGKRSPGKLSWGGINNTYFWIDPSRGIAGVILMHYLPFADWTLAVYDAFERGTYQLVRATR